MLWTSRTSLHVKTCVRYLDLPICVLKTDVFLFVFGRMGFLQLKEGKNQELWINHGFLESSSKRQGIRKGNLLVYGEYSILFSMKLSPQHSCMTRMLFAQGGLYKSIRGLLEFHCYMLYSVFPICGYIGSYLDLFQDKIQNPFFPPEQICSCKSFYFQKNIQNHI